MAKEWGTPITMLGRVGDGGCLPCAAAAGVGAVYDRALPAGGARGSFGLAAAPEGMGPLPWAGYPGSGGPNHVVTDVNGPSPEWFRNTITQPVISPDDPQNRQRVFNGGIYDPSWAPWAGKPIRGYEMAGLGNLVRPWAGGSSSFTMGVRGLGSSLGCAWAPSFGLYNILGAMVAGAHGYARNRKAGWALMWATFGFLAPIFTNGVAIVQGLGKSKSSAG